jgi:hypothetical protein
MVPLRVYSTGLVLLAGEGRSKQGGRWRKRSTLVLLVIFEQGEERELLLLGSIRLLLLDLGKVLSVCLLPDQRASISSSSLILYIRPSTI